MTTSLISGWKLAAEVASLKERGFHVTGMKVESSVNGFYVLNYVEDWEKRPKIPQPELFPACNPGTVPPH